MDSKSESDFRSQLISSRKGLFEESKNPRLLDILKKDFPGLQTAYVLQWIPDQGEDTYLVYVDAAILVWIEIDHEMDATPKIEHVAIDEYKRGLKRQGQIQFEIATELSKNDINV